MRRFWPQRGMTLIEMMVAMTISTFLIAGAITVYIQTRSSYRTADSVARMQETANFALDVIAEDLRLAGFWGQYVMEEDIDPNGVTRNCGPNDFLKVTEAIEAWDEEDATFPCVRNTPRNDSDVLVVRHASLGIAAPMNNRVQVESTLSDAQLIDGGVTTILGSELRNVVVNSYYVSHFTEFDANLPSLRRVSLAAGGGFQDEEVVPGVENLQIQFGVSTNSDNSVDGYFDPDNVPASARIIAARIWVLVRSEVDETGQGYEDSAAYPTPDDALGNLAAGLPDYPSSHRRMAVTRTVLLNNNLLMDNQIDAT